jgi:ABC-type sugar transport system substrate-binding protein
MKERRFESQRARAVVGGAVVAVALAAAGVLGGVGFAKSSVTAAQYQYGKVTICHHTHSAKNPFVTITISVKAWPAHKKHGDTLGACIRPTTTTTSAPQTSGPGKSGTHGKSGNHGNSGSNGHGHKK